MFTARIGLCCKCYPYIIVKISAYARLWSLISVSSTSRKLQAYILFRILGPKNISNTEFHLIYNTRLLSHARSSCQQYCNFELFYIFCHLHRLELTSDNLPGLYIILSQCTVQYKFKKVKVASIFKHSYRFSNHKIFTLASQQFSFTRFIYVYMFLLWVLTPVIFRFARCCKALPRDRSNREQWSSVWRRTFKNSSGNCCLIHISW